MTFESKVKVTNTEKSFLQPATRTLLSFIWPRVFIFLLWCVDYNEGFGSLTKLNIFKTCPTALYIFIEGVHIWHKIKPMESR